MYGRLRRVVGPHPGQAIVLFAAAVTLLVVFVGLSVDVGYLLSQRRTVQNAADAAAMAGARVLLRDATADPTAQAKSYVTLNGYPATEATVTYSSTQVTVQMAHTVPKFFIQVVYSGPWTVKSTAVAAVQQVKDPAVLVALRGPQTDCNTPRYGINIGGGGTVNVSQGNIASNGCIAVSGTGTVLVGGSLEAYGTIPVSNNANVTVGGGKYAGEGISPDPLSGMAAPPCSSPAATVGTVTPDPHYPAGQGAVLTPGYYDGTATTGGSVSSYKYLSLRPGVYCFITAVKINSNGGLIQSVDDGYLTNGLTNGTVGSLDGVALYFSGSSATLTITSGEVHLKAAGLLSSPPLSCTGQAICTNKIVVWMSSPGCNDFTEGSNGANTIDGVIYAPCAEVTLNGGASSAVGAGVHGMVVARDIVITGGGTLNLQADYGNPTRPRVFLVQ